MAHSLIARRPAPSPRLCLARCAAGYYVSYLTFQQGMGAVRSATAMPKLLPVLVILSLAAGSVKAAFETPKNQPVEITSTGQTNYENNLAIARENVAIHIG